MENFVKSSQLWTGREEVKKGKREMKADSKIITTIWEAYESTE